MVTRQWVAIHRKHHQLTDQRGDPHSPQVYGIWRVLFGGAFLYHHASQDATMLEQYGRGTPDDWMERCVYTAHSRLGIVLMLIINLVMFGVWGVLVWIIQMLWIPFWAAGVVNGVGHWWGYRNGHTEDQSRNIVPWGIVIGGEELHNNHHLAPASPRLSRRWFELDLGWLWFSLFKLLGLASLRTPENSHKI
jgi:stearoyl-CoA desaturase (delta-9 desaturase)